MERIINQLKDELEGAEQQFISNSLIVRATKGDQPIPDTDADLDCIVELREAMHVLRAHKAYCRTFASKDKNGENQHRCQIDVNVEIKDDPKQYEHHLDSEDLNVKPICWVYSHKTCKYRYIGDLDDFMNNLSLEGFEVVQILNTNTALGCNNHEVKILVKKLKNN